MPRGAAAALAEYAETWATRGVRAWADSWWDMSVSVGDEIAPLLCAPPGSVSMLPNVTIASAVILSNLTYEPPRNRIVLLDGEFSSVRYVYEALATRLGARIVTVPSPAGDGLTADEERIADAIDERTALVAVSHVLFKSAFVVDVRAIAEKCRRVGALLAVDAYRPGVGIRLSPRFYTEDAELDRAFAAIDEIRETEAWRRRRDRPSIVT